MRQVRVQRMQAQKMPRPGPTEMTAPGVPRPYPDELLYSLIARSARYLGHWSPKGLTEAVYGRRTVLASPDLPSSLLLLKPLALTAWEITPEQLAHRHTLVGYYTHYLGAASRRHVVRDMLRQGKHLHVRLGICSGVVKVPQYFRLCALCAADDMRRFGETYWRRAHHLPGVLVCHNHGAVLHECTVPFRPPGRHEYIAAHPKMLSDGESSLLPLGADLRVAWRLALDSAALLDAEVSTTGPLHDYRGPLDAHGFGGRGNRLPNLHAAVERLYGEQLLSTFFKTGQSGDPLRWLAEAVRVPRRQLHPLKHLILQYVLLNAGQSASQVSSKASENSQAESRKEKTWGLFRQEAIRKEARTLAALGLTTNAVARALEVDWKTAFRLLAPVPAKTHQATDEPLESDKQAWLHLSATNPSATRSELRNMDYALHARLYRQAREWLAKQGPQGRAHATTSHARVDWAGRDAELSAQVEQEAICILKMRPLLRVSRSRILSNLGKSALVSFSGAKLPMTQRALDFYCESVEAFQVRKLTQIIQQESHIDPIPDWKALREARINPSRREDRGGLLLKSARQRLSASGKKGE